MQRANSISIFKTSVCCSHQSEKLVLELLQQFPGTSITFDLDDCDRVLRVVGTNIIPRRIIELLTTRGFDCLELE